MPQSDPRITCTAGMSNEASLAASQVESVFPGHFRRDIVSFALNTSSRDPPELVTVIELEDRWVWDSWYVVDGATRHAFYLAAPKSLGDPDLRHSNAVVAHSTSTDLVSWTPEQDALAPGESGRFDDLATWTGSVIKHDGVWHLFYTGIATPHAHNLQRIGHATSPDLTSWTRVSDGPISTADPRWYSTIATADEPWRDPWVFELDGLWHMLITARDLDGLGTIGHATSPDLETWTTLEPLATKSGFTQLEVPQVIEIDGKWMLVFCLSARDVLTPAIRAAYGTYSAPADGPLGPFHLDRAEPIGDGGVYAGRVVRTDAGEPVLMGFIDDGTPGGFRGVIADPLPLHVSARGTLQPLTAARASATSASAAS
jgi:beta-fructofuranosidase